MVCTCTCVLCNPSAEFAERKQQYIIKAIVLLQVFDKSSHCIVHLNKQSLLLLMLIHMRIKTAQTHIIYFCVDIGENSVEAIFFRLLPSSVFGYWPVVALNLLCWNI